MIWNSIVIETLPVCKLWGESEGKKQNRKKRIKQQGKEPTVQEGNAPSPASSLQTSSSSLSAGQHLKVTQYFCSSKPHVKQRLKIPFLIQNIPGETPARARHLQQLCMLLQPHSPCAAPHLSQLSLFSPPFPPRATGSTQFPLLTQTVPLRQITSHNNFQATDGIAVTIRALLSQRREPKTRCSLLPGRDP